jgi:cytoskeletal protein CcmA (bactofilin family)
MFSSKDSKKELEQLTQVSTIVAKGTLIHGDIESSGNIRIEGKVIGNVKAKSKVAVGESGCIEGNLIAINAEIAGEIKGTIEVSELVIIKPSGTINGDIITMKLSVDSGATINGSTKMISNAKEIKLSDEKEVVAKAS